MDHQGKGFEYFEEKIVSLCNESDESLQRLVFLLVLKCKMLFSDDHFIELLNEQEVEV